MRIIAGRWRGRRITAPSTHLTRPTADRVRESLFNVIASLLKNQERSFEDCRVLDVFAGSGALGFEAISRGAPSGAFIEQNVDAFTNLLENIQHLKAEELLPAYRRDACDPGKPHGTFNMIFLDPPYGKGLAPRAVKALERMGWIAPDALIIVETGSTEEECTLEGFACLDRRLYGSAQLLIFARTQVDNEICE
jgi:16S rRNA (guanine(966)-N(2))-methyltransferase RsmD